MRLARLGVTVHRRRDRRAGAPGWRRCDRPTARRARPAPHRPGRRRRRRGGGRVDGGGRDAAADQSASAVSCSKRSSSSPTGSSTRVMPATDDRAGNDADLVGGVARVVGLPQRVRTPPAAHVAVDDRHEVHRLARGLAQRRRRTARRRGAARCPRPPGSAPSARHIARTGCSKALRHRRTASGSRPRSAGCSRASVRVHHLREAVAPGDVEPRRAGGIGDGVAEVAAAVEVRCGGSHADASST